MFLSIYLLFSNCCLTVLCSQVYCMFFRCYCALSRSPNHQFYPHHINLQTSALPVFISGSISVKTIYCFVGPYITVHSKHLLGSQYFCKRFLEFFRCLWLSIPKFFLYIHYQIVLLHVLSSLICFALYVVMNPLEDRFLYHYFFATFISLSRCILQFSPRNYFALVCWVIWLALSNPTVGFLVMPDAGISTNIPEFADFGKLPYM